MALNTRLQEMTSHSRTLETAESTVSSSSSIDDNKFVQSSESLQREALSKAFVTKTESGKKLRVTFRNSRSDSQESNSSQNTVIEHPTAKLESKSMTSASGGNKPTETAFEKLKQELFKDVFDAPTTTGGETTITTTTVTSGGGPPRVTVLRRGSATPSMNLARTVSTTTSTVESTSTPAVPVVKTVSFAASVTSGDSLEKEVKVYHKRQSSLNGTESTTSTTTTNVKQEQVSPIPPPPPPPVEIKQPTPPILPERVPQKATRSQSPVPPLPPTPTSQQPRSGSGGGTLQELEAMPSIMRQLIAHFMACNNDTQQADLAGKMAAILEQAWNRGGARGVDVAELMCRDIRTEGALSLAFSLASSNTTSTRDLRLNTFRLLVSSFSSENRVWIANQVKESGKLAPKSKAAANKEIGDLGQLFGHAAETLHNAFSNSDFDAELCLAGFGIVRSLMAHSNETICTALDHGVLEAISQGLRILPSVLSSSPSTELNQIQSTLSASIATMSTLLQSATHHQQVVNNINAVDRLLLPICNADDNPIAQYFALLSAVSFHRFDGGDDESLVAAAAPTRYGNDNRSIRASMAAFLSKQGNSPSSFPFAACSLLVRRGPMSIAIRPDLWLKRFLDTAIATSPGKVGFAPEIQGMALFHIAVELERVLGTGLVDDFVRSAAFTQPLVEIAESPNHFANRLAAALLTKIGTAQQPQKTISIQRLSNRVPHWSVHEVRRWLTLCVGLVFDEEAKHATEFLDGDLLLTMPFEELRQALFHHASNKAKLALFARHLTHLKLLADYSAHDNSDMDGWLGRIEPKLRQYTYAFLHAGIDRHFATNGRLDDTILNTDCGIANGVHRQKILTAANCMMATTTTATEPQNGNKRETSPKPAKHAKWLYDVFICYKRASGSQLASLLKVYLEMRGYRVFLDVTDLSSGLCYDRLVETIGASRHFLLVLTGGCLDSVLGDEDRSDWVHREIYAALRANSNIIPIADSYFTWPSSPNSLPGDIRRICSLNTIKWLHDYQQACVDKIEKFITDNSLVNSETKQFEGEDYGSSAYQSTDHSAKLTSPPPRRLSSPSTHQTLAVAASVPAEFIGRGLPAPHNPPNPLFLHQYPISKTT